MILQLLIEKLDHTMGSMSERELEIATKAHKAGQDDANQSKAVAVAKPNKAEIETAFEVFWRAGMRKMAKAKARPAFIRAIPAGCPPMDFAVKLCRDVEARIRIGQGGFDAMHPTTYLNSERWEDEMKAPQQDLSIGGMGEEARVLFGLEPAAEEQTGFVFDQLEQIEGPADDGMALLLQASRARLEHQG